MQYSCSIFIPSLTFVMSIKCLLYFGTCRFLIDESDVSFLLNFKEVVSLTIHLIQTLKIIHLMSVFGYKRRTAYTFLKYVSLVENECYTILKTIFKNIVIKFRAMISFEQFYFKCFIVQILLIFETRNFEKYQRYFARKTTLKILNRVII